MPQIICLISRYAQHFLLTHCRHTMAAASAEGCVWYQRTVSLTARKRGCHLISEELQQKTPEIAKVKIGVAHITIMHTSASICLNEGWDPDVLKDTEMMLNRMVPENLPYKHSCEGSDDMPAHIKAALIGSSISVPITDGRLRTGTWQAVWLCEHRNHGGSRNLVVTIQGAPK